MTTFEQVETLLDEAYDKIEQAVTILVKEGLTDEYPQVAIRWARKEIRDIAISLGVLHRWAERQRDNDTIRD